MADLVSIQGRSGPGAGPIRGRFSGAKRGRSLGSILAGPQLLHGGRGPPRRFFEVYFVLPLFLARPTPDWQDGVGIRYDAESRVVEVVAPRAMAVGEELLFVDRRLRQRPCLELQPPPTIADLCRQPSSSADIAQLRRRAPLLCRPATPIAELASADYPPPPPPTAAQLRRAPLTNTSPADRR